MTGRACDLSAVRFPLDPGPAIDPFALAGDTGTVFCSGGRVLVGLGNVLTLPLPGGLDDASDIGHVSDLLASIRCEDHVGPPGSGVMGFGALPFDRSAVASLAVPGVIYGDDGTGREWVTLVTDDPSTLPPSPLGLRRWLGSLGGSPASGTTAAGPAPRVDPVGTDESFRQMVSEAVRTIDDGELEKVVLARQVDVILPDPVRTAELLRRWRRLEPNCSTFSVPTDDGQFIGASPELLVERVGLEVHSRPLAGTTGRFTTGESSLLPAELLDSTKDSREHRLVVEAIERALAPICSRLDVPPSPELVHLHNITHLGTPIVGTLSVLTDGSTPTVLELVAALHPTPAVGGVPSVAARDMIARLEPRPRGTYGGPVGYLDAAGDGRWMVGIRAMTLGRASARLTAGVGIVHGSEPSVELAETNLKFTAVFDALAPGLTFGATSGRSQRAGVG